MLYLRSDVMYRCIKRIFDLIISVILFIILLPLFMIISILIKLEDGGPIIYKQERIGYKNKKFKIYKFRSMNVIPLEEELITDQNERITKIGSFIRKTSIDELPQLINIIKGEMSFVGPRPWCSELFPYYTEDQKRRHLVRPGVTGYAQVSGRNQINILDKIAYDLDYVEKIGFIFDIKVCLSTIKLMFKSFINSKEESGQNQGNRNEDLATLKKQWNKEINTSNKEQFGNEEEKETKTNTNNLETTKNFDK